MGKVIENYWDCNQCDTKGIMGRHKECPNCGRSRDEYITFYMKETKVYVDTEAAKKISKNPDWVCSYCKSLNSDNLSNCDDCGASKEESEANYFENKQEKESIRHQKEMVEQKYNSEKFESSEGIEKGNPMEVKIEKKWCAASPVSPEKTPSSTKRYLMPLLMIVLLLGFIAGLVFLVMPKTDTLTVKGFDWSRSIGIEEYKTFSESGWSAPIGARITKQQSEVSGQKKVLDHNVTKTKDVTKTREKGSEEYVSGYKDLGNGYSEEITATRKLTETYTEKEEYQEAVYKQVAVYSIKYYYDIDRWVYTRSIETAGIDKEPKWGKEDLIEKERIGTRTEKYYINVENSKEQNKRYAIDFEDWQAIIDGQSLKVKIHLGNNIEILK